MAFRASELCLLRQATLVLLAASFAAGCNCNATEYSFPPVEEPTPVDPPVRPGSWLSFDTSPEGQRLTMSYYDPDAKAVGYAIGVPSTDGTVAWVHERVDGYAVDGLDTASVGTYTSQKTAPDGTVWVAYHDFGLGGLKVAHRTGGGVWDAPQTVDGGTSLPGVGLWTSLALDANGLPVVAHCDAGVGAVRVSRFDGTQWSTTQVYASRPVDETDADGVVTTRPAGVSYAELVISGGDEILAFYDSAAGSLHVMRGSGGSFTDEIVDDDGDTGAWPSVWVSGSAVWVAYQDVGNEDLRFAESTDGGWIKVLVDGGELRGADTALFERDGEPAIVYFDGMNNDSWLATRAGSEWSREAVGGETGAVGFHNEVVFAAGQWWTGSYDYTAQNLFVKAL